MSALISEISGIHVDSEFLGQADYEIFNDPHVSSGGRNTVTNPYRFALIYGENGSGKTSIARCFESIGEDDSKSYLLKCGKQISILNNEDICVFNEDYIDNTIKLREDGLSTIVLLDSQVDISKQIDELVKGIAENEKRLNDIQNEMNEYEDPRNTSSPLFWKRKVENILKKDGGWAYRDGRSIRGHSINASVTDSVIEKLANKKMKKSLGDAQKEYEEKHKVFMEAKQGEKINMDVPKVSAKLDFGAVKDLLFNCPPHPNLSQREKDLMEAMGISVIKSAQGYLESKKDDSYCETCLQQITGEYKAEMLKKIDEILNDEVAAYSTRVEGIKLEPLEFEIPETVKRMTPGFVIEIENNRQKVNKAISDFNNIVQKKLDNIFEPVDIELHIQEWENLQSAIQTFNGSMDSLDAQVNSYNSVVDSKRQMMEELIELSDTIAHYQILPDWNQYETQKKKKRDLEQEKIQYEEKTKEENRILKNLYAKRRNVKIAADSINRDLGYIYGSAKRFRIELNQQDQLYHLISYGKEVEPKNISVGERNILALCYYFTRIAKNNKADSMYKTAKLLVIDDPVSSFDSNVRLGLMSYFRKKLGQILRENNESKVLILTHDIPAAAEFEEIIRKERIKEQYSFCGAFWKIENKKLAKINIKSYYEYDALLDVAVKFAKGESNENEFVIGNILRKILEAFSTFAFRKGADQLDLNSLLTNPEDRCLVEYYNDLMYKFYTNRESHLENAVKGNPEGFYFSAMSLSDKQRAAKDVLSLIYLILPSHMLSYRTQNKEDFEKWVAEIRQISNSNNSANIDS
jgi:wobble nucleotide-excising tRNase